MFKMLVIAIALLVIHVGIAGEYNIRVCILTNRSELIQIQRLERCLCFGFYSMEVTIPCFNRFMLDVIDAFRRVQELTTVGPQCCKNV